MMWVRKLAGGPAAALVAAWAVAGVGCAGQAEDGSGGSGGGGGMVGGGGGQGGAPGGGGGGGTSCAPSWTPTADCGGVPGDAAPDFGPNVLVFDPTMAMSTIQGKLDQLYGQQDGAQFGDGRYAYFFKPGKYDLDVKVGFYTQVLGLGRSPDDVVITGAVRALGDWLDDNHNATCNFWRGGENFAVAPRGDLNGGVNVWAVSQGTELRRVHIRGDLHLDDAGGWSSGGFVVDSLIDGQINSGTQQQFLTRNNDQDWAGSNWNMVFVGDPGAPAGSWPNPGGRYTVADKTPRVREKPFLYLDDAGHYLVMVPGLKTGSSGHSWGSGAPPGVPLTIDRFYVAHPGQDTAATMNAALAAGKQLLLTPGIYHLQAPLQVTRPNTIVMGLGRANLVADNATALVTVADVDGVSLAGLLLEAGPANGNASSPTLLQLGEPGSAADHGANPTFVFDLACRIGGAHAGTAHSCVVVNSRDVVIDNAWLWRADHGEGADWYTNKAENGIIVNGDDVTAYGLFVEHFQQYQTLWNGNGGEVYFYQSEMPYDPPNQGAWMAGQGHNGYPSYKVADGVTSHHAEGMGVYSVFSNDVTAANAYETPTAPGVVMTHLMTVSLSNGQITHILNGSGNTVGNGGGFDAYY